MKKSYSYYAVIRGFRPGIYDTWLGEEGARQQINGFPNALFKGFSAKEEAVSWFQQHSNSNNSEDFTKKTKKKTPVVENPKGDAVIIYTDGACQGNPGPGGYGVLLKYKEKTKKLSGGFRKTTNNRMELTAVIKGLEALKRPSRVIVYSDSSYVVNAVNKKWLNKWQKNKWQRNEHSQVENIDLWKRFLDTAAVHQLELHWLRGHNGHEGNEICDRLAVSAANGSQLEIDHGYENRNQTVIAQIIS